MTGHPKVTGTGKVPVSHGKITERQQTHSANRNEGTNMSSNRNVSSKDECCSKMKMKRHIMGDTFP